MSRGSVLGLDLSLRATGFAAMSMDGKRVVTTKMACPKLVSRFASYTQLLDELFQWWPNDCQLVAIEAYSFASRGSAILTLVELGTWVRQRLWKENIPFVEIAPATLKAWVTNGVPHADKLRMRECAQKKWGKKFPEEWDDNVVDAYCLAQMARYTLDPKLRTPEEARRFSKLVIVGGSNAAEPF